MSQPSKIVPRNGHTLVVGIGARISGCVDQKEQSLDDQEAHAKEVVAELYDGSVEYRIYSTKGKGERLDRPELFEMEAELRTNEIDLFVFEDLGRFVRGTAAVGFLGVAVDHGTRVIAPNDCIDTDDETWEEDAIAACRDHVGHNSHTSKRIKKKLMNRFVKLGAATARPIYGYIVSEEAKTYFEWKKDPEATKYIEEGARRLKETLNCSAVADWFNAEGVPVGPYCRRDKWDGAMVRRYFSNTLLKGEPIRGRRKSVKQHETGRRVSVPNPDGPNRRKHPELAHLNDDDFDELNSLLTEKNAHYKRKPVNGTDPLLRTPRKRTRFPGQLSRCYYCGRLNVWGGNGIANNMMCNGARKWQCWNSLGFDGTLVAKLVAERLGQELKRLPGFDEQFREFIRQASLETNGGLEQRASKLCSEEAELGRQKTNIGNSIATAGPLPALLEKARELDSKENQLRYERREIERMQNRSPKLPESVIELQRLFEQELEGLTADSYEFGDLMRKLVTSIDVYLVQLCDGGHYLPRARVRLSLDRIIPDARTAVPGMSNLLFREFTIDLFDPPQRERIRPEVSRLSSQDLGPTAISKQIPENPSLAAVQRSLALIRKMESLGLTSPYVLVTAPPDDFSRFSRHKNPKFQFSVEDGYEASPLTLEAELSKD